jgi:uncharacterized tellurite resistance protein B-like protein
MSELKNFTEAQRKALLDLAMIAMYADGKLTSIEDERVNRLLTSMGCDTDYDRGRDFDAAISRVSRQVLTAEGARSHAATLAQVFTTREQRQRAYDLMMELITSDNDVTAVEGNLLSVVKEALHT